MPEFAKYLPPECARLDRSVPVVVNTIVNDCIAAGWPKTPDANPVKAA